LGRMKLWELKNRPYKYEPSDPRYLRFTQTELSSFMFDLQLWTIFVWPLLCVIIAGQSIDFKNEPVLSSPGLYYQRGTQLDYRAGNGKQ
jgi:hypothetical protein